MSAPFLANRAGLVWLGLVGVLTPTPLASCGVRSGPPVRAPEADLECRNSSHCRLSGDCVAGEGGTCVPGDDADCRRSEFCEKHGLCFKTGSFCAAKVDADCRASTDCVYAGKCHLADEECEAASEADCLASDVCTEKGYCHYYEGKCLVFGDDDCRRSRSCIEDGRCTAVPQEVLDGGGCKGPGPPHLVSGGFSGCFSYCGVAADADCRQSTACTEEGRCTARGGECVAGATGRQ